MGVNDCRHIDRLRYWDVVISMNEFEFIANDKSHNHKAGLELWAGIGRALENSTHATVQIMPNHYTKKQRSALHVWCEQCAEYLDSLGEQCEINHPFGGDPYLLPWSMILFKEHVYKYVLTAMEGIDSTEKQTTVHPSKVAAVIIQRAAQRGRCLPSWPSKRG